MEAEPPADEPESSSTQEQETPAEPEEPADVVEACGVFRITLPAETAQYLEFSHDQENCLTAYYGDTLLFELAAHDTYDYTGSELKHRVYSCGYGADADGWHEVTATFPYITADGAHDAHWNDKDATVLSLAHLIGITDEDVLPGIQIQVASGERLGTPRWDAAVPVLVSDDAGTTSDRPLPSSSSSSSKAKVESTEEASESSSSAAGSAEAFWGVWAGAFKDQAKAEELAARAREAGWPDAAAYTSTDWAGLNPERWYVVSLARCVTQDEAKSAAKQAQKQGFDGAYANYTGDHVG